MPGLRYLVLRIAVVLSLAAAARAGDEEVPREAQERGEVPRERDRVENRGDIRALDRRFREVAARAIPATVLVKSTLGDGSGRSGFGSGAVVSGDGFILTCAHVVDIAGEIEVTLASGRSFPAKLLGKNRRQDYALLKVEASGLAHFKLGDSRKVRLGEWVVAIGHPGGPYPDLRPAFSVGKVTGLHRVLPVQMMDRYYDDAIRTDAPIFAGNSGGPLVTLEGDLVGLNGAILLVNENSYAVPIHEIAAHLDPMKRGEDVAGRSPKGGSVVPIDEFQGRDLARFLGRAGRRLFGRDGLGRLVPGEGPERDRVARSLERLGKALEGDRAQRSLERLFEAFGGGGGGERGGAGERKLPDLAELRRRFGELFGGDGELPDLGELRKRAEQLFAGEGDPWEALSDLLDRLGRGGDGERPGREPAPEVALPRVFLGVVPATGEAAKGLRGVLVAEVVEESPAARAGIRAGDVIAAVAGIRILGPEDLLRGLERRSPGDRVAVKVLRGRLVRGVPVRDALELEVALAAREEEPRRAEEGKK